MPIRSGALVLLVGVLPWLLSACGDVGLPGGSGGASDGTDTEAGGSTGGAPSVADMSEACRAKTNRIDCQSTQFGAAYDCGWFELSTAQPVATCSIDPGPSACLLTQYYGDGCPGGSSACPASGGLDGDVYYREGYEGALELLVFPNCGWWLIDDSMQLCDWGETDEDVTPGACACMCESTG